MRGLLLALMLWPATVTGVRAEEGNVGLKGWFGLEMFEDMSCANNPVWIEWNADSGLLDLRWRKTVVYSDGSTSDAVAFRLAEVRGSDLWATRLGDGVPVLFRLAPDLLSFEYLEGDAIKTPVDPELRVVFVRCEFQGS